MEETKMYVNGAYWKSMILGPTDVVEVFVNDPFPIPTTPLDRNLEVQPIHKIRFHLEDVLHCEIGKAPVRYQAAVCLDPGVYIDFRTGELKCHKKYQVKQVAQRYGLPVCEGLPRKVSTIVSLLNSLES